MPLGIGICLGGRGQIREGRGIRTGARQDFGCAKPGDAHAIGVQAAIRNVQRTPKQQPARHWQHARLCSLMPAPGQQLTLHAERPLVLPKAKRDVKQRQRQRPLHAAHTFGLGCVKQSDDENEAVNWVHNRHRVPRYARVREGPQLLCAVIRERIQHGVRGATDDRRQNDSAAIIFEAFQRQKRQRGQQPD